MSLLSRIVDERFLAHRRRSTGVAGIVGGSVPAGLFAYRYYVDHIWSAGLLAVAISIVAVKLALTSWYLVND
jgi:hypothetical protein